ncbi:unnamed protein product [Sphagnum tenellum]
MGNSTDPEDSGASQPPPWSTGDGRQMDVAPTSQPESLEITVPSSNDQQESGVPPSVTAVVEGRSIGQRVCLHDYNSYEGFAQAMRKMFEDCILEEDLIAMGQEIHLGNAIPGYVIAYEDEEGDLLLAGDLGWREFVRAAKRIRIVSAVKSSRPNVSTGALRLVIH